MPLPDLPEVGGIVSPDQVAATAAAIADVQEPDGAIPWFRGGHTDPWDHVECAMALTVGGRTAEAERAYGWLQDRQRADGSWAARYEAGVVTQDYTDANFCGYIAVGVWHHTLVTGGADFAVRLWPTVRAALDVVVGLQRTGGDIAWSRDHNGAMDESLLTSSSSLYHSLRAGLALAQTVDQPMPDWELAAGRLGHAIRHHPERFLNKKRWSMDWYYPVLGGAVRGADAEQRIAERWDEFWVEGLGIRCVADRPWVTGAETCELGLSLDAIGWTDRAVEVLASMQHLREEDGSYWTGYVYDDGVRWPVERSTWTGAAMILLADAVARATPGSGIFRSDDLPLGVDPASVVCDADADRRRGSVMLCDTAQQP